MRGPGLHHGAPHYTKPILVSPNLSSNSSPNSSPSSIIHSFFLTYVEHLYPVALSHAHNQGSNRRAMNVILENSREDCFNYDSGSCFETRDWKKIFSFLFWTWDWKKEIFVLVSRIEIGFLSHPVIHHHTSSSPSSAFDMVGVGAVKLRGNIRRSWLLAFQDYYAASPLLQRWDPDISAAVQKLEIRDNKDFPGVKDTVGRSAVLARHKRHPSFFFFQE